VLDIGCGTAARNLLPHFRAVSDSAPESSFVDGYLPHASCGLSYRVTFQVGDACICFRRPDFDAVSAARAMNIEIAPRYMLKVAGLARVADLPYDWCFARPFVITLGA